LTESAEQDLIEIWSFIAADNRTAASKLVREIQARFETVQDHPEIGPRRDQLAECLRVHFHRDYALYYRFTDTEVVIVRPGNGPDRSRSVT
jgi:toxin ParE1/3/4